MPMILRSWGPRRGTLQAVLGRTGPSWMHHWVIVTPSLPVLGMCRPSWRLPGGIWIWTPLEAKIAAPKATRW
eukprot:9480512-Pyramimonas_sp.AAC.1